MRVDFYTEGVIGLTAPTTLSAIDNLDATRRLLAVDAILGPTSPVYGRVDELGSCMRFAQAHRIHHRAFIPERRVA